MAMRSHILHLLVWALVAVPAVAFAQSGKGEFVVVSGGPALRKWENLRVGRDQHDQWWGNFIRPARVHIAEIRERYGRGASISWLVYRPAYTARAEEDEEPLLSFIRSVQEKYGCRLVWFSSGNEVIEYINRGRDRRREKVVGFDFFGHSNKYCMMFDYSNQICAASKAWLHVRDIPRINRKAFSSRAVCKSWGCHTGEAMSAEWKRHLGIPLVGAVGKTDYRWIWQNDGQLPSLARGSRWVR
jgi:hypothetical protein